MKKHKKKGQEKLHSVRCTFDGGHFEISLRGTYDREWTTILNEGWFGISQNSRSHLNSSFSRWKDVFESAKCSKLDPGQSETELLKVEILKSLQFLAHQIWNLSVTILIVTLLQILTSKRCYLLQDRQAARQPLFSRKEKLSVNYCLFR